MSELTLQLPDDVIERLNSEAERQQIPLNELVIEALEFYLEDEGDLTDDDEPTKAELLEDLRQSFLDAFAGRTYPADELIEELRRKYGTDADDN